ncbi:bifunctional DNA primase/polymerase [Nocardia fusca]|uniref:bifunctional DNA primase/polymerase n=1 Tax=Nocardia fusca TaxID=941183 RepID=UPI000B2FE8E7|nr:bifunctional DNA primase/polymerase [Nocardia fusca]
MPTTKRPDPIEALSRGLAVFPLPPGEKAAPKGWQHTIATGDIQEIRARWRIGANIGIACRASGIVGVDLDRHTTGGANAGADGVRQFSEVCRRWGQERPVTLEVATPHDGRHLLFRVPAGLTVPSVSGGTSRLGPGIDIRGPGRTLGAYLAGPGSVVDGREYTIEVDAPIAILPGWLAALIGRRAR